ncbi:MAG: site-2 protease family protein [Candidatus Latescibacteria bacterium]|nr:site-2 protease family protein [Candidatus Latescibacterota bacterium]
MADDLDDRRPEVYTSYSGNGTHSVYESPPQPKESLKLHIGLFLATVYTTTMAGMLMSSDFAAMAAPEDWTVLFDPRYLIFGLPFSATLLAILGVHEMGHYLTSRYWGVRATLPYFIPFPSMIGTLGAVIKLRSRIPNRRALIDIGASGPIAGFIMSVIALGVGLGMSEVIEARDIPQGSLSLGDSLLSAWLGELVVGNLPAGYDVMLHPVAFAGWLGLFVTVLNLLPMGQFDGGHIIYAIFGRKHRLISRATMVGLALMWLLGPPYNWLDAQAMFDVWLNSRWIGWLVWLFMAMFLGRSHPPPQNPFMELDPPRRWIGYASLAIFVLCFIPDPIRIQ